VADGQESRFGNGQNRQVAYVRATCYDMCMTNTTNEWRFIDARDYSDDVPPAQWPYTAVSTFMNKLTNDVRDKWITDRVVLRANTIDNILGYDVIHVHEYDEHKYEDVLGFAYLHAA
jgi:hypothetical protein